MLGFFKFFLLLNYFLLVVILALVIWKYKLLNKKEKLYAFYIVFLFVIELLSFSLPYVLELKDTSFLYPFYIAGEFFLLTAVFLQKLSSSRKPLVVTSVITLVFLLLSHMDGWSFNFDLAKVVSNIIIICLVGFVLLKHIKNSEKFSRFTLVDACIFFYYSVSVFFFIVQQQLKNLSEDNYYLLLALNSVLATILYSSIIYTFLKLKK